jgi:hypothetical protein
VSESHPGADCRLLVPMRVQALTVTDPGSVRWADLTPQYDLLDADEPATLGFQLRPNLFADPPEPPGAGVHLHWALPTAFKHVDQEPAKPAVFRAVPNRWLVVRLWQKSPQEELRHRAWVVESDYLAPDGTNPWLTLEAAKPRRFRAENKLGRAVDLQDYTEEPGPSPLRAFAPGNLAFASFYPSCRNVFGFHDKEDDLEQDVIYSYVIVGWFADPGKDPLSGCADKDWPARMGKLGWSVPDGTKVLPKRILCHGAVQNVRWPPPDSDRVIDFPRFEIAVGNSALDAIAALVDQKTVSAVRERDRLLGQLQFAVLQDRPPTAAELFSNLFLNRGRLTPLRARLHEKTFTALPGGTHWEIDRPGPDSDQAAKKASAVLELSDTLADMLRRINRDQREYDRQLRELTGLQRDLYAQWYKRRLLTGLSMPSDERGRRTAALDRRIGEIKQEVDTLRGSIGSLQGGIDTTARAIRAEFSTNPTWRGHVLIGRPMPRYWRANDPTLLMAGVPIPAIQNGASPLVCRVTGQTISSLFVPDVPGFGAVNVSADNLKAEKAVADLSSGVPAGIRGDFAELLCEALLLDPQRAQLLARIAFLKQLGREPSSLGEIDGPAGAIGAAQRSRSGDNFTIGQQRATSGAPRVAFDTSLSATVTSPSPWTLLFMVWSARYQPSRSDPTQDVLKPWRFDGDDVDYGWREQSDPTQDVADVADYQGYAPLSDTVGRGLSNEKEPFPWMRQYPEDAFVFNVLAGGSLAVQSMGGMTEALIMQDAAIQLPPLKEQSLEIDEEMRQLVGEQYAVAPLTELLDGEPAKFFPVRGGHLDIRRLWLVDTFGRTRRVIERIEDQDDNALPPQIYISRSLAVPGSADLIRLPPRLAQPSRLLFRWLSADSDAQEFLGDIATQPICGWILPNRLDQSLLICDAAGKALGAVQSVIRPGGFDNRGIRWSKLPLAAIDPALSGAAPRPGSGDIPNRHLLGFVNGLLGLADETGKCPTGAFQSLLELIGKIGEANRPLPGQQDLSVLVGRPLALVRASLRLDLMGPPAVDQSWSQLAAATPTGFTPTGFIDVPFDVRLGDRRKGPDGLVGYFLSDRYDALRLARDLESEAGREAYFQKDTAVPVTCKPAAPATLLTLLMDPRLGVHVSSGILPTKIIDLPADLISAGLSTLEVPFLVAPVLGERLQDGVPNIPLPTDMAGTWTWTWRPAAGAEAKSAPIKSETAPARSLFGTMALYEGWLALHQQRTDRR